MRLCKAFASSNGGGAGTSGSTLPPVHAGNGLTDLGKSLISELNRLGGKARLALLTCSLTSRVTVEVMVDLSHTTDSTAAEVGLLFLLENTGIRSPLL